MTDNIRNDPGRPRAIAVVGAGFCGIVVAAQLLRMLAALPTRIVLVERSDTVGSGVAYAQRSFPYQLNVPAARMSALAEDSAHLLRFAQRRLPGVTPHTFLPRQLYGEYLREVLGAARANADPSVCLETLHGETTSIHSMGAEGPLIVSVGTKQLLADQVVLACGDPAPAHRPYAADLVRHPAYSVHPYAEDCLQPGDRALLLIGTGLTMADVAIAAAERNPGLHIIALSRHGLLPQRQLEGAAAVLPPTLSPGTRLVGSPLRQLVRSVRALARAVEQRGGDWREAIGRVREVAPEIWHRFDEAQRRRFLRHVRTYWDVHRHRMPPETADRIEELQRTGRLRVLAGAVTQLCADGPRIVALWRPRGRYETRELWVDRVIDCSGPDLRLARTSDRLWRQLMGDGLATVDASGLGIRTGRHGALIDSNGRASARLFYVGPMLRAAHWEATAVGELRVHARALAAALAGQPHALGHVHMTKTAPQPTELLRGGH